MAKNFVQDGTTIELVNAGDQTILSGAAVVVGSMVVVVVPIFLPVRPVTVLPKACSCCPNSLLTTFSPARWFI